jgi:hypothetical protein
MDERATPGSARDGRSAGTDRLVELGRAHLALGAAAVVSTLSVIRLLRVSGGSPTTALAILQAGGTGTIATAMLLSIVPLLLAMIAGSALLEWLGRLDGRPSGPAIALLGLTAFLVMYLVPAPICLTVAGTVGVVTWKRWRGMEPPSGDGEGLTLEAVLVPVVLGCFFVVLSGPWWPAEIIERRGGETDVGYVIGTDPREIVVLDAGDSLVRRHPRSEVLERRLCDERSWWRFDGRSPLALLFSPSYDPCP